MYSDPVSDMLTRIRNGSKAKHKKVDVPVSQIKVAVADILKNSGFIKNYRLYRQHHFGVLRIYLRYSEKGQAMIRGLKRISRPSRRVYVRHQELPAVLGGLGVSIVSTSKGVMSDQMARESRLGGELLCNIW